MFEGVDSVVACFAERVDGDAIHHADRIRVLVAEQPVSLAGAMVDRYTVWTDWTDQTDE